MASPVESLSVRKDPDRGSALHSKTSKDNYDCISNFFFTIKACVKFPPHLRRYNGWILDVHRTDDVSMECFVTCDEMQAGKPFLFAINRRFNENCGVYWHHLNDAQLIKYTWNKVREFRSNGGKTLIGSLTTGRQTNLRKINEDGEFLNDDDPSAMTCNDFQDDYDSSVYIINENVQMNKYGVIPKERRCHIWMVPHLRFLPAALGEKNIRAFLNGYEMKIDLPLKEFNWHEFICKAKSFFQSNFMPFIIFLSGGISAFHYQKILPCVGACPVATAVGQTASGKSTALKIISKLLGMSMVSQSSGEFVVTDLTRSTFPLCWDDPTHPSSLRQPLVAVFNGLGNQTHGRGNEKPITSFLLTVNFKIEDDARSFERTVPIWFQKVVNQENEKTSDFLDARKMMFSLANTHSVKDVIAMSSRMNEENLTDHISFFKKSLNGLPSRLAEIYSVYRLFSYQIIELVNDTDVIDKAEFKS